MTKYSHKCFLNYFVKLLIVKQVIGTAITISSLIMVAYQGQERRYNVFIVIQWNIYT